MAEDEDGVSNKKSAQNSNNAGSSQDNEQNRTDLPYFPRLLTPEIDEAKCNNSENGDASPAEAKSSSSKSTGATRKEENPFSFRHFLKRDLSLPGTSTYESTGARPKVYASTVQHSPTRPDTARDPQAKEKSAEPRASDNTSSNSSVEVSHNSVVDNSECDRDPYAAGTDPQPYRAGLEPLGMPSLPDFVQDHILVEQAYLNSNGPISVDLDNLPDFTFNTNYNAGGAGSLGRRGARSYGGRGYSEYAARGPLDLPPGAEGAPPPDVPLSLDLTESVNPADRRNMSPRSTFPLDLPPNAESMRLPDFLPVHPGRTSPEPEPDMQPLLQELERTRSELNLERRRCARLEDELRAARLEAPPPARRHEAQSPPARRHEAQSPPARRLEAQSPPARRLEAQSPPARRHEAQPARRHAGDARATGDDAYRESPESESLVNQLRIQIRRLKEELAGAQAEVRSLRGARAGAAADLRAAADVAEASLRYVPPAPTPPPPTSVQEELAGAQAEVRSLRGARAGAAADLRAAADVAEASLRDLLAGLDQLRSLSHTLDPT
ncbi:serine/arginine repetitive matrix protein 1-like isoform X2 [Cydia strobilella]|uniref:serine/arginine repetitive matrix protein 1-like isoform X2 n=1 Tax=Cydia strobilella TaxID=1100964 RepID=UPI0030067E16